MPSLETPLQQPAQAPSAPVTSLISPTTASGGQYLIYFGGMKKLIGEAVAEGVYVEEALRDRGIEEAGVIHGVVQVEGLKEVKELQGDVDSIGCSLKQLKSLLSELPTFQPTYTTHAHKQATLDNPLHAHIYFPNVRPFEK